ncbi:IS256 family transposase [Streptomyces hygroscopicus]|uniref:IS256 family transposase n=1 Tax=Streptomyces hygroscopicus TaxID=1912 RepID=UPI00207BA1B5|nr:IS256 family transposase [Streptomyces hygroscopicus]
MQQLGYPGGELAVQRHLRRYRSGRGHAPASGPKPPSVREATSWIMTHPEHLRAADADKLHRLRERDAELDRLTGHVRKFAAMMAGRHGDRLEDWISDAEQDTLAPLASFARNLRRDLDAVRNGLTLPRRRRRQRQPAEDAEAPDVRPGQPGSPLQTRPARSISRNHPDHKIVDRTKIRDGAVANRPIYVALAVTTEGQREILGLWAGDGGEGAKHWLHILTEIKNRGVSDVLMLVCDGLKGLPEAVETVWPRTIVQTCVVHLLRNSFRYAARQDWDKIAKLLKPVCTAPTEEAALDRFAEFADAWGRKYPAIVKLWENAWEEFTPFLRFDTEIRRIVCTTNAIESVNARIRRAVKSRGHFPNEQAALKCVYMAIMSLDPTGKGQARWTMRWKTALNAFDITFDGRLSVARH